MEKIIKSLEKNYKKLLKGDSTGKKNLAIQRFNEVLLRLENRKNELAYFEETICDFEPNESKIPLEKLQNYFIDKTEGFHQQIYSTISTFSMLLNHVAPRELIDKMPTRSNEKILNFLSGKYKSLKNDVQNLELSRSFRIKFDHIQQSPLFDWMTESFSRSHTERRCVVIFFIRKKDNGIYSPGPPLDSYSAEYFSSKKPSRKGPPFSCESYYVNPYYKDVYQSAINVFVNIIKDISKSK